MPQGLLDIMDDYMAALDEGLWCLLQHHRLLPTVPVLVQNLLERCPAGSELPRALKWIMTRPDRLCQQPVSLVKGKGQCKCHLLRQMGALLSKRWKTCGLGMDSLLPSCFHVSLLAVI